MKIIFAGTPEFALPTLELLLASSHQICAVYTKPDRPAGRGQKLTSSPVKQFALDRNLPIYQPEKLRDQNEQSKIKEFAADVLVNVAYGLILPDEVLNATRFGCFNIHPSLLPRWRGAAPIQRSILAGDEQTGVTIMQMDSGLDTGSIIKQISLPIAKTDSTATLYPKLAQIGAQLLLEALDETQQNGQVNSTPQDSTNTTYAHKVTKEEANIDWKQSATQIDCMIRSFNPWPIAYSEIDGESVRVWQACPVKNIGKIDLDIPAAPGTIINCDKQGIDVSTGDGVLRIEKLQLAGSKILAVQEVLNAKQKLFSIGQKFN